GERQEAPAQRLRRRRLSAGPQWAQTGEIEPGGQSAGPRWSAPFTGAECRLLFTDQVRQARAQEGAMSSVELFTREEVLAGRASERLRWLLVGVGQWLDRLPPFWFAFAFTLTETVGMSILALPIALARVGPLPGIAILALMGAINLLTVLSQAE